jgi:hypothetical protein
MKKTIQLLLFFICIFTATVFAQDDRPQDAGLWSTISIDKELSRRWSVGLDEELRMFDNMSRIDQFFTNAGVSYKPNKFLKFSVVYRFISKSRDDKPYSNRHRLYFDAAVKKKFYDFSFNYRARVQGQLRDIYSSDEGGKVPETFMRHKIGVDYQYKKFTPNIAAEFFFQFNDPGFHYGDNLWDRTRLSIGCDYEINKRYSAGLFYLFQHDFNVNAAEDNFILGVQFGISL